MPVAGLGTKQVSLIFVPKAYSKKLKKFLCLQKNGSRGETKKNPTVVEYHYCSMLLDLINVSEKCLWGLFFANSAFIISQLCCKFKCLHVEQLQSDRWLEKSTYRMNTLP